MADLFELVRYNMEIYQQANLPKNTPEMAALVSSCFDVLKVGNPDWAEYEAGEINDVAFAKSTLSQWLARQDGTWEKTWHIDEPPDDIDAVWAFTQLILLDGVYNKIFDLVKEFFDEFKWNIQTP